MVLRGGPGRGKARPITGPQRWRSLTTSLDQFLNVGEVFQRPRPRFAKSIWPVFTLVHSVQHPRHDQARTFLDFAKDNRLFALYATVLSLGLRLGERLGISWNDVNLESGRFNVCQSLQRIDQKLYPGKGGLQLVEPKGGYSHRVVTLPVVAVVALRRRQARQERKRLSRVLSGKETPGTSCSPRRPVHPWMSVRF